MKTTLYKNIFHKAQYLGSSSKNMEYIYRADISFICHHLCCYSASHLLILDLNSTKSCGRSLIWLHLIENRHLLWQPNMKQKRTRHYRYRCSGSKIREERSRYHRIKENPIIATACRAYEHLYEYHHLDREHFISITLDGSSRVINTHIISIGTLNQSLVHLRWDARVLSFRCLFW